MSEVAAPADDPNDPLRKIFEGQVEKLNDQQISDLLARLVDGRTSAAALGSAFALVPTLVQPVVAFVGDTHRLLEDASDSEKRAFASTKHIFDSQIEALNKLAAHQQTPEVAGKIADGILEAAKMAHQRDSETSKISAESKGSILKNIAWLTGGLLSLAAVAIRATR